MACCATVVACQLLVTFASNSPVPTAPDGGPDVSVDDAGVPPDEPSCGRTVPGPPPSTPPGLPSPTRYFVVTSYVPSLDGGVGFDLDCLDSNCDRVPSAPPRCRASDAGRFCDEPNGVDNQAQTAASRAGLGLETQAHVNLVQRGEAGIVLAVGGYSGEDNDSEITVSMFPTAGVAALGCRDAGDVGDASGSLRPRLDGCDVYWADGKFANQGVPIVTANGYVVDRTLVVRSVRAYAPYGIRVFEYAGDILEAKLETNVANPSTLRMRGIVAGRLSPSAFLPVLGEQREPGQPPLCADPTVWDLVRTRFCVELDMATPGAEPAAPCDSISLQVAFEAEPVHLSKVEAPPRPPLHRDECYVDAGPDGARAPLAPFTCPD